MRPIQPIPDDSLCCNTSESHIDLAIYISSQLYLFTFITICTFSEYDICYHKNREISTDTQVMLVMLLKRFNVEKTHSSR